MAWTALIVAVSGAGWGGYTWVKGQFSRDEAQGTFTSPDGAYIAVSRNYDSSTYGYDYLTLEPAHGGIFSGPERVAELKVENLYEVSWKDARTLEVVCTLDRTIGSRLQDQFVKMPTTWRDVKIEYAAAREMTFKQATNGRGMAGHVLGRH